MQQTIQHEGLLVAIGPIYLVAVVSLAAEGARLTVKALSSSETRLIFYENSAFSNGNFSIFSLCYRLVRSHFILDPLLEILNLNIHVSKIVPT